MQSIRHLSNPEKSEYPCPHSVSSKIVMLCAAEASESYTAQLSFIM